MSIIKLAWKNLMRRPLNLLLVLCLFGLGIGLINVLRLVETQLKSQFDKNLAGIDLVLGAKGSPLQMILSGMYHIDNPTGNIAVKEIRPFLNPKHPLIKNAVPLALGDSYKGNRIVGTNEKFPALYNAEIESGKTFQHDFEVVIGKGVADIHQLKLGDEFDSNHGFLDDDDLKHEHHNKFKVVGIYKPTGSVLDQLVVCSIPSIWKVHDHEEADSEHDHSEHSHEHEHVHNGDHDYQFDLAAFPEKEVTNLMIQYKSRTNYQALNMPRNINENTNLQAAAPSIEINRLYSMMGIGLDALRVLGLVIALVSAISIFISLYSSLKSRIYELAMMRVMGAGPATLTEMVLFEGLLLSFFGFLFGFVLSHIALFFFTKLAQDQFKYAFSPWQFDSFELVLLGFSLLIGLIAALIPAISAYKIDIHKVLSKA